MHKHACQSSRICSVCGAWYKYGSVLTWPLTDWHLIRTFMRLHSGSNLALLVTKLTEETDYLSPAGAMTLYRQHGLPLSPLSPSVRNFCLKLEYHPNCDRDQLARFQTVIMIQQHKCYIRLSSACKWWPLNSTEWALREKLTFSFVQHLDNLGCFTAVSECHLVGKWLTERALWLQAEYYITQCSHLQLFYPLKYALPLAF